MNRILFHPRFWSAGALFLTLLASCQLGSPTTGGGTEGEGVVGALVDPVGAPLGGAWVKAYPVTTSSLAKGTAAVESVQTDANGAYAFLGISQGTYNLTATITKNGTTYALLLQGVVVTEDGVDEGADTVRIAGSVTFQVRAGGQAVEGAVCAIDASPWMVVSDETGTCSLTGLPPGSMQFSISHPAFPEVLSHFVPIVSGGETEGGVVTEEGGAPAPPALVSPTFETQPRPLPSGVLVWQRTPDAQTYHAQISLDSSFTSGLVLNDSGLTDSVHLFGPLDSSTVYFWRVRSEGAGGKSPWSRREGFLTFGASPHQPGPDDSLPPEKPHAPTAIAPASGAIGIGEVATLTWASDTSGQVFRYRLLVGTDSLFQTPILDDMQTVPLGTSPGPVSRVTPRLAAGTTYMWRVTAIGPGGETNSPVFSYTTASPLTAFTPFTIEAQSPAHEAVNVPVSVTLSWTTSLPGSMYDLTLATDSLFSTIVFRDTNLLATQWYADSLLPGTRYFWKVRTRIPAEAGVWERAYNAFTTAGQALARRTSR